VLLEAFEQMKAFNAELEPLRAASAAAAGSNAVSGVIGLTVTESDAHACAAALSERWQRGQLKLHDVSGKLLRFSTRLFYKGRIHVVRLPGDKHLTVNCSKPLGIRGCSPPRPYQESARSRLDPCMNLGTGDFRDGRVSRETSNSL
jgi:hypothetical protein